MESNQSVSWIGRPGQRFNKPTGVYIYIYVYIYVLVFFANFGIGFKIAPLDQESESLDIYLSKK